MPIYEYRCAKCNAYYKHLARTYLAPAPPCPRCGYENNTRLISKANVVHGQSHHEQAIKSEGAGAKDTQQAAQLLQESGRLHDADGLYGSESYRELVYRRSQGAGEAEVADLVDDLAQQMQTSEATQMAGAVMFSKQMENRMAAEGPPEEHEEEQSVHVSTTGDQPKTRDDLGWVTDSE